ncbi:cell division protein ZapA [Candidatus Woesearchaeota archaeon]|nr:cell division protein ZapA [Candidatus Woesearchaeota archaeon]
MRPLMATTPNRGLNNDDEMRLLFQANVREYMHRMREYRLPDLHDMMDRASEYGLCHGGELGKNYNQAVSLIRNYCRGKGTSEDLESAIKMLDTCRKEYSQTNGHPPNIRALVLVELNTASAYKRLDDKEQSEQAKTAAEAYLDEIIAEEITRVKEKFANAEEDILDCLYR